MAHYKYNVLNERGLVILYDYFMSNNLLNEDLSLNDFLYFFSGKGDEPEKLMSWKSTSTLLSLFVHELTDAEHRPEWGITQKVFANVKGDTLRDTFSKAMHDRSRSYDTFFTNKTMIKNLIEKIKRDTV